MPETLGRAAAASRVAPRRRVSWSRRPRVQELCHDGRHESPSRRRPEPFVRGSRREVVRHLRGRHSAGGPRAPRGRRLARLDARAPAGAGPGGRGPARGSRQRPVAVVEQRAGEAGNPRLRRRRDHRIVPDVRAPGGADRGLRPRWHTRLREAGDAWDVPRGPRQGAGGAAAGTGPRGALCHAPHRRPGVHPPPGQEVLYRSDVFDTRRRPGGEAGGRGPRLHPHRPPPGVRRVLGRRHLPADAGADRAPAGEGLRCLDLLRQRRALHAARRRDLVRHPPGPRDRLPAADRTPGGRGALARQRKDAESAARPGDSPSDPRAQRRGAEAGEHR